MNRPQAQGLWAFFYQANVLHTRTQVPGPPLNGIRTVLSGSSYVERRALALTYCLIRFDILGNALTTFVKIPDQRRLIDP